VHRKKLRGPGPQLVAERAGGEERVEFLASRSNWFRPVTLANAPDGCLWICDMAREVIEHPWSLPEPLKQKLDLDAGREMGRLLRIVPDGFKARPPAKLGALSTAELIALLDHPNGWHRDTAARLLHQRQDPAAAAAIAALVARRTPPNFVPRINTAPATAFVPPKNTASRAEAWKQYRPALEMTGDPAKGQTTFSARCAVCHRFAGKGNNVGPDLDAAAGAGREKLLGNILEPSREITAGFALGMITLKSGEAVAGLVTNETPAGITLRLPGGAERPIVRGDIAKTEHPAQSLMPEGIETGMTVQEMADLLEFLAPMIPTRK
jgi:putative heme-binding domain-containing protein